VPEQEQKTEQQAINDYMSGLVQDTQNYAGLFASGMIEGAVNMATGVGDLVTGGKFNLSETAYVNNGLLDVLGVLDQEPAKNFGEQVASTAGRMMPVIGVASLTGGGTLALGAGGAVASGAQAFGNSQASGDSYWKSLGQGALEGATEYIGGKFLDPLISKIGSPAVRTVLNSLEEAVEEIPGSAIFGGNMLEETSVAATIAAMLGGSVNTNNI